LTKAFFILFLEKINNELLTNSYYVGLVSVLAINQNIGNSPNSMYYK
jgi:hypothetical protein